VPKEKLKVKFQTRFSQNHFFPTWLIAYQKIYSTYWHRTNCILFRKILSMAGRSRFLINKNFTILFNFFFVTKKGKIKKKLHISVFLLLFTIL